MSITVNVQEAKTRLSELLRRVEDGEDVVLARAGKPIARIQAAAPRQRDLEAPLLPELPPISTNSLFEPMPEHELSAWEQNSSGDPLAETA